MKLKPGDLITSEVGFIASSKTFHDGHNKEMLHFNKVLTAPVRLLCVERFDGQVGIVGTTVCWKCIDMSTSSFVWIHLGLLQALTSNSGFQIISPG